jgi:hypothetical protein
LPVGTSELTFGFGEIGNPAANYVPTMEASSNLMPAWSTAQPNWLGWDKIIMRFRLNPRDVPPAIAARRLGLTAERFAAMLPSLIARGFPRPDPDTGNLDLAAIDRWCDSRHPHLFGGGALVQAREAGTVAQDRIAAMRRGSTA